MCSSRSNCLFFETIHSRRKRRSIIHIFIFNQKSMEDSISSFCKTLASFCNHLQTSSEALKLSVDRRPIPLDSASSTFVQCLNRRVSSASSDLNLLESMSFGTVSFEELLGHCNEVYKKNQNDLSELEDRLKSFGYVPEIDFDEDEEVSALSTPLHLLDTPSFCKPTSATGSIMKGLEDDPLCDESLSLRNLGLSDVCLATLASEANGINDNLDISLQGRMKHYVDKQNEEMGLHEPRAKFSVVEGDLGDNLNLVQIPKSVITVSKDDYESLPSYMKSLASWEDLLAAVEKINLSLRKKENTKEANFFHQDELMSLGLGHLIAQTEDEYVQLALQLASDVTTLSNLRMSLRDLMLKSPVCDGSNFIRGLESTYRNMWQRYCKGDVPSLRRIEMLQQQMILEEPAVKFSEP